MSRGSSRSDRRTPVGTDRRELRAAKEAEREAKRRNVIWRMPVRCRISNDTSDEPHSPLASLTLIDADGRETPWGVRFDLRPIDRDVERYLDSMCAAVPWRVAPVLAGAAVCTVEYVNRDFGDGAAVAKQLDAKRTNRSESSDSPMCQPRETILSSWNLADGRRVAKRQILLGPSPNSDFPITLAYLAPAHLIVTIGHSPSLYRLPALEHVAHPLLTPAAGRVAVWRNTLVIASERYYGSEMAVYHDGPEAPPVRIPRYVTNFIVACNGALVLTCEPQRVDSGARQPSAESLRSAFYVVRSVSQLVDVERWEAIGDEAAAAQCDRPSSSSCESAHVVKHAPSTSSSSSASSSSSSSSSASSSSVLAWYRTWSGRRHLPGAGAVSPVVDGSAMEQYYCCYEADPETFRARESLLGETLGQYLLGPLCALTADYLWRRPSVERDVAHSTSDDG